MVVDRQADRGAGMEVVHGPLDEMVVLDSELSGQIPERGRRVGVVADQDERRGRVLEDGRTADLPLRGGTPPLSDRPRNAAAARTGSAPPS